MSVSLTGVFGGTFDPPHLGHLILASESISQLGLDRLLWVLTPEPPHKTDQPITALQQRLEMLRLAIADEPRFELSKIELTRPGPHYTVETLRMLKEQAPERNLVFLMGGDSLRDLPGWYQPAELIRLCHTLGVMRRPGDDVDLGALDAQLPGLLEKVRFVDVPLLEISSRQIRQRVADRAVFRYYLPEQVYEYIVRVGLYQKP